MLMQLYTYLLQVGHGGKRKGKEKPQKPNILLEETKQYLETELGKSAAVMIIIPSSQG
jgi:hypothetical protein